MGYGWGRHKTSISVGTRRDDTISVDSDDRLVLARRGDDTVIFEGSDGAARRVFANGGSGRDTLLVDLTTDEWANEDLQAELVAFQDHLADLDGAGWWARFTNFYRFENLSLTASHFETLVVQVDGVEIDPANPPVEQPDAVDDAFTLSATGIQADATGNLGYFLGNVLYNDAPGVTVNPINTTVNLGGVSGRLIVAADGTATLYMGLPGNYADGSPVPAFAALAEGQVETQSITYTTSEGATATIELTVVGVDDAPALVGATGGDYHNQIWDVAYYNAGQITVRDFDAPGDQFDFVFTKLDNPDTQLDEAVVLNSDGTMSIDLAAADGLGFTGADVIDLQFTVEKDGVVTELGASLTVYGVGRAAPPPPPPPPPPSQMEFDDIA